MVIQKLPNALKVICLEKIAFNISLAITNFHNIAWQNIATDIETLKNYLRHVPDLIQLVFEKHFFNQSLDAIQYIALVFDEYIQSLIVNGNDIEKLISLKNKVFFKNLRCLRLDTSDLVGYLVEQANIPQFLSTFSCFSYLTKLCTNYCTDNLLRAVGFTCHNLHIFDCHSDRTKEITDVGLECLTRCQSLMKISFNSDGDEFDYEDRYFNLSGMGFARLLMALPKLMYLECEVHLLRDAVKFLLELHGCEKVQYNLRNYRFSSIWPRNQEDIIKNLYLFQSIKILFPHLTSLTLIRSDQSSYEILADLHNLTHLVLIESFWYEELNFSFSIIGNNLKVLHLFGCVITPESLKSIVLNCCALEELILSIAFLDDASDTVNLPGIHIDALHTLKLRGDFNKDVICFFLKCPNLKCLELGPTVFDFINDELLFEVFDNYKLDKLEKFWVSNCTNITVKFFEKAVSVCHKLKIIGDLHEIDTEEREKFINKVKVNNWDLRCHT